MTLDRSSSIPLYQQVQHALISFVKEKDLQPGDRIWSENEITRRFGVARSVARQALTELDRKGIVRRTNSGTFLSSTRGSDGLLSSARGLHEDAAMRGHEVTSTVLVSEISSAPTHIAHQLDITPGTDCFHLIRIRNLERAPWTYVDSWMPADLLPGIQEHDFSSGSLYEFLAKKYGVHLAYSERSVEADSAREEIARHLKIPAGAPVLTLRSIGFDNADRPVDTFIAYHRADRSRFVVRVEGSDTGGHVITR